MKLVPPTQPTPTVQEEFVAPPVSAGLTLSIITPTTNMVTNESRLQVRGMTAPAAEVFVNDLTLKADSKGNFSTTVMLDEGENIISVSANDVEGNYATEEIIVTYES